MKPMRICKNCEHYANGHCEYLKKNKLCDRKKLWFLCALSIRTTDRELAKGIANMVVRNIKNEEEYHFVKNFLEHNWQGENYK